MQVIPSALLSLFIVTTFISTIHAVNISTLPPLIDDGSCCKFELENLVDEGSQKFIPSSAIPALIQNGLETYFFITEVPITQDHTTVGAINNTAEGYAFIWAPTIPNRYWTTGAILANPNQCVVGWHVAELPLADTNKLSHPKLSFGGGKVYFGRYNSFIGGTYWEGTHLNGVNMVTEEEENILGFELLYVDCFASLKNQLSSELYHIELDRSLLREGDKKEEEVISSTEVTNNSDEDQVIKVDLNAEMFSLMKMTHESKLYEFSQTEWGVHGSADLGWIGKIFGASFSLDGGYDAKSIKENFTRTGSVSVESKRTVYKLNQEIKVKARTTTQVFIKTRPIRGDTQFTAYYRLKPKSPSKMWTHERIIASMRRAGFEDWDKTKTENGSLVMPIRGQLAIETGFETVAEVVSTPLGSDSPAEVMRSPLMPTR